MSSKDLTTPPNEKKKPNEVTPSQSTTQTIKSKKKLKSSSVHAEISSTEVRGDRAKRRINQNSVNYPKDTQPIVKNLSFLNKEKKEYIEKCNIMKKRILKLEKEKKDYDIKLIKLREKQIAFDKVKYEKIKRKKLLQTIEREKDVELRKKKKKVEEMKSRNKSMLAKTSNDMVVSKRTNYKKALIDKYFLRTVREQFESARATKNISSCMKRNQQKSEFVANKLHSELKKRDAVRKKYEANIVKTKEINSQLQKRMSQLETIENDHINDIKQTKKMIHTSFDLGGGIYTSFKSFPKRNKKLNISNCSEGEANYNHSFREKNAIYNSYNEGIHSGRKTQLSKKNSINIRHF